MTIHPGSFLLEYTSVRISETLSPRLIELFVVSKGMWWLTILIVSALLVNNIELVSIIPDAFHPGARRYALTHSTFTSRTSSDDVNLKPSV